MATYNPVYKGYIADVPVMWFRRCDGKVFYFDELTNVTATPQTNFTEINAGHSLYPVAYIPGQSTLEMQFRSGQFNNEIFSMSNNKNFRKIVVDPEDETKEVILTPKTEHPTVELEHGATSEEPYSTVSVNLTGKPHDNAGIHVGVVASYSGKNYLNAEYVEEITTSKLFTLPDALAPGSYTISFVARENAESQFNVTIMTADPEDPSSMNSETKTAYANSLTFDVEDPIVMVTVRTSGTEKFYGLQLEDGSSATSYEPYVGGEPTTTSLEYLDDATVEQVPIGKFIAKETESGVKLVFNGADLTVGNRIEITYDVATDGEIVDIDNKSVAVGEVVLKYPVYSDGTDCNESSIKGYVVMKVYRARITQMPGFEASYKQAQEFSFSLSAMDAKRDDGYIYSISYVANKPFTGFGIISQPPAVINYIPGEVAYAKVVAVNAVSYQWQFSQDGENWVDLPGPFPEESVVGYNTDILRATLTLGADGSKIRCVVSGAEETATTTPSTLTVPEVVINAQPVNCNIGTIIRNQPLSTAKTVRFTVAASYAETYQWACNDTAIGEYGSTYTFTIPAGTTWAELEEILSNEYHCNCHGYKGGTLTTNKVHVVATIRDDEEPDPGPGPDPGPDPEPTPEYTMTYVITNPSDSSKNRTATLGEDGVLDVREGEVLNMSSGADASFDGTFAWKQQNGTDITTIATSTTFMITMSSGKQDYSYWCELTNKDGTDAGSTPVITINIIS